MSGGDQDHVSDESGKRKRDTEEVAKEPAVFASKDEPSAKKSKEDAGGAKADEPQNLDPDDAAWLLEEDGRRLKTLDQYSGARTEVSSDGKVQFHVLEGVAGGIEWADQCLRAMCAMRNGIDLKVTPVTSSQTWTPPMTVVDVPKDAAKGYILGKNGDRLLQLSEDLKVVAVFVEDATPADKPVTAVEIVVGSLMEAKFEGGSQWHEVEILSVDEKVRVRWTHDANAPNAEIDKSSIRAKATSEAKPADADEFKPEVGELVEGKAGNGRWFEAKVVTVGEKIRVKWMYDDAVPEKDLELGDVRAKKKAVLPAVGDLVEGKYSKGAWFDARVLEVGDKIKVKWTDTTIPDSELSLDEIEVKPPPVLEKLHIYGLTRSRMEMELKVLQMIESKVPDFVSGKPRQSDEGTEVGWTVEPLLNNGEMKGKVIGKGGSVRAKIGKTCSSSLEYIGNLTFVVGTGEERARTVALLKMVQIAQNGAVDAVPDVLSSICTWVSVPQAASPLVIGKQRGTMNQLEDETGTLSFWGPTLELKEGTRVEGQQGTRWLEAKIDKVIEGERKSAKVIWVHDEQSAELPLSCLREVGAGDTAPKTLLIFGPERARKLAELRVMSLVETKCAGTYPAPSGGEGFATESRKAGNITEARRKVASAAAHCIIEQVGEVFHIAGTASERSRAQDYLGWLSEAKHSVPDAEERGDGFELVIPADKVKNLPDYVIEEVEQATDTLAFFDGTSLLIFGSEKSKRDWAVAKFEKLQHETPQPRKDWGDSEAEKRKVVYVVSKEEEERRAKRAARFGPRPVTS